MQPQVSPKVRWEWIGQGWQMFTRQWQSWVAIALVYLIAFAIPIVPLYLLMLGVAFSTMPVPGSDAPPDFPVAVLALYPVFYLIIILMASWLGSGMYRTAFKQLRGEKISVGDLFSGGPYFLRFLGASVLMGIITMAGSLLCIIPGFIAMGMLFFTIPLIVEGNMSAIDAIKKSFETTKQDWLMFTLFTLVIYFLASAGVYACGIGVLATMPLMFATHAIAYRDTFGVAGAGSSAPASLAAYQQSYEQGYYPPPPVMPAPETPAWQASPPSPAVPEAPPQTPQRFCINCGAEVRTGSKFCPRCGNTLPT